MVFGMASMEEELYIVYYRPHELDMHVHSNVDLAFRRRVPLPYLGEITDMIACAEHKCLYFASIQDHVFKIMTDNKTRPKVIKWQVFKSPFGLSLIKQAYEVRLLVTFDNGVLVEMNEDGGRVREIVLKTPVDCLYHAVKLKSGRYVISYREKSCMRREMISIVDDDGMIMQNYGDSWMPWTWRRVIYPRHMAVDGDGFVFVTDKGSSDLNDSRVVLLNPSLQFVRSIAIKSRPLSLHLHQKLRRLFIKHDFEVSILQL